jgi:hypothetical protein
VPSTSASAEYLAFPGNVSCSHGKGTSWAVPVGIGYPAPRSGSTAAVKLADQAVELTRTAVTRGTDRVWASRPQARPTDERPEVSDDVWRTFFD